MKYALSFWAAKVTKKFDLKEGLPTELSSLASNSSVNGRRIVADGTLSCGGGQHIVWRSPRKSFMRKPWRFSHEKISKGSEKNIK